MYTSPNPTFYYKKWGLRVVLTAWTCQHNATPTAMQKLLTYFFNKNVALFELLMLENLMKR